MLHTTPINCPYCTQNDFAKNGKTSKGVQRWRCNRCKKHFQLAYKYIARKQGIKEKIIEQTLNSSGVRDTGRVLGISKDTVTSVLKKNSKSEPLLSYYRRKKQTTKPRNSNKVYQ